MTAEAAVVRKALAAACGDVRDGDQPDGAFVAAPGSTDDPHIDSVTAVELPRRLNEEWTSLRTRSTTGRPMTMARLGQNHDWPTRSGTGGPAVGGVRIGHFRIGQFRISPEGSLEEFSCWRSCTD